MGAATHDATPADHWWCADCARWGRVDDADLCAICAEEHGLVRLLDMVLETDQLAYQLEQLHWRAWDQLTDGGGVDTGDLAERIYHGEAEAALSQWLHGRERERYTIHDLYLAGYDSRRHF
jgi:hypothetical protein